MKKIDSKKVIKKNIESLLGKEYAKIIKKLNTPSKIQDFLDTLPINFEEDGETYMSPKKVIEVGTAHCFEGALFALVCLKYHSFPCYLLDLKTKNIKKDSDHTVAVFRIDKYFGAISKTNHGVLRYRDPIYKNEREIAISYFHEYFLDSGEKTLFSFSKFFDAFKKFGFDWIVQKEDLDDIAESLDKSPHTKIVPKGITRHIRKAGKIEIEAGKIVEWSK